MILYVDLFVWRMEKISEYMNGGGFNSAEKFIAKKKMKKFKSLK